MANGEVNIVANLDTDRADAAAKAFQDRIMKIAGGMTLATDDAMKKIDAAMQKVIDGNNRASKKTAQSFSASEPINEDTEAYTKLVKILDKADKAVKNNDITFNEWARTLMLVQANLSDVNGALMAVNLTNSKVKELSYLSSSQISNIQDPTKEFDFKKLDVKQLEHAVKVINNSIATVEERGDTALQPFINRLQQAKQALKQSKLSIDEMAAAQQRFNDMAFGSKVRTQFESPIGSKEQLSEMRIYYKELETTSKQAYDQEQAYFANLRKDAYQSLGEKDPFQEAQLAEMRDYYSGLERESDRDIARQKEAEKQVVASLDRIRKAKIDSLTETSAASADDRAYYAELEKASKARIDSLNKENKLNQEKYNRSKSEGLEIQRTLNAEENSISAINNKLIIQKKRLEEASFGSSKYSKISDDIERLNNLLAKTPPALWTIDNMEQGSINQINEKIRAYEEYINRIDQSADEGKEEAKEIRETTQALKEQLAIRQQMPNAKIEKVEGMKEDSLDDINAKLREYNKLLNSADIIKGKDKIEQYTHEINRLNKKQTEVTGKIKKTTTSVGGLGKAFDNLTNRIIAYGVISGLQNFAKNIVDVTGKFEQTEVALGAILGDIDEAQRQFSKIQADAVNSPFSIMELADATKMLSAYGYAANELNPTLNMMADLSAGVGVEMSRLVYNMGQIRAQTVNYNIAA